MRKESENGVIRKVPKEISGVNDGVELFAKASITSFDQQEGQISGIAGIGITECKMLASYENGIVSISLRNEHPIMVSVRLEEMMSLLQAAAAYSAEVRKELS